MKPTLGRIVLYRRHGSPNGQHAAEDSPAVITRVYPEASDVGRDKCVDLCVMNPSGLYFDQRTPYDTGGDGADPKPGHWRWLPRV